MIEIDLSKEPEVKTKNTTKFSNKKLSNKRKILSGIKKERGSFRFRPTKFFSFVFILLSLLILGLFMVDRYGGELLGNCEGANCIIKKSFFSGIITQNPELQQANGKTSILVVGLDSRSAKKEGEVYRGDLMNTDTLIQIIYDHETQDMNMVSIPRDLYVNVPEVPYEGKINGLFTATNSKKGEGEGIQALEKQIESMTGVQIQYYTIVTFQIVEDLIDTFGEEVNGQKGLYIDVPESFKELFPDDINGGYFPIYFEEGNQFLTTEELMQYSRARQLTSDWKRAERQQQVIDALKDRVLSTDSLLDLNKLLDLYTTFKENVVMSAITAEDIRAALEIKDELTGDYTSIVLDPSLGGINRLIRTLPAESFQGASIQGPSDFDYTYSSVSEYLQKIFKYPAIYEEEAKVVIYNYTGEAEILDPKTVAMIEELPLDLTIKNYALKDIGYEVYDFSDGENLNTLKTIETKLGAKVSETIDTETGLSNFQNYFGEDISIRVGTQAGKEMVEAPLQDVDQNTVQ